MFEVFAEREYHVARVEPLATLPVDKRLHVDIRRIRFADRDARANEHEESLRTL
jgi:hypothetical protein